MEIDRLAALFSQSPSLKFIRSDHAPFVIGFLHQQFRGGRNISVAHEVLRGELIDFQSEIAEQWPGVMVRPADEYLTAWCNEDTRILFRRVQGNSLIYQLTATTELVIRFVEEVLERDSSQFVGTESRMRRIVDTLQEISVQSNDDPDHHIRELERERDRIDDRIRAIRKTGDIEKLHDAQIRERFFDVVELLKDVLSDFRQVEDSFREITREVQQRDALGEGNRGHLLGFALDAEEQLQQSDQGISFAGFQREILVPEQQEKLRELIAEVKNLDLLSDHEKGMEELNGMMPRLTDEANQVMQTMRRLSSSIRRFLDAREAGDRRQVSQMIVEIRNLARDCEGEPPPGFFIEIEDRPDIGNMPARDFWSPPPNIEVEPLSETNVAEGNRADAFSEFAKMQRLDWERMRHTVERLTQRDEVVSLPRLLEEFPPRTGAVEVLGYIQIAKDDDHVVIEDKTDEVVLAGEEGLATRILRVPKVVFRKEPGPSENIRYQHGENLVL